MEEFINKMVEIGVSRPDAAAARDLADELSLVHRVSYRTRCNIKFINDQSRRVLKFDSRTGSYNIFLSDLSTEVSRVEFPITGICCPPKVATRKEKLLSITFNEIRHRVTKQSRIRLYSSDLKIADKQLNRILSIISFLNGTLWDQMLPFEKRDFDAKFVSAASCYYHRLNFPIGKITRFLFSEPKVRHS